jgi:hypothetical protein
LKFQYVGRKVAGMSNAQNIYQKNFGENGKKIDEKIYNLANRESFTWHVFQKKPEGFVCAEKS